MTAVRQTDTRVDSIPDRKVLTLLQGILDGQKLAGAARATGIGADIARHIAADHGFPNRVKIQWSVDELTRRLSQPLPQDPPPKIDVDSWNALAEPPLPDRGADPDPQPTAARAADAGAPPARSGPAGTPGDTDTLLREAFTFTGKRVRGLAEKITADLELLRRRVDEGRDLDQQRAERDQQRAEREQQRTLIADLKRQLAEAKAALTPPASTKRATQTAKPRVRPGGHTCHCGRTFDTPQGLNMHNTRAHLHKAGRPRRTT
jgi:hypothetical protein